MSNGEVSFDSSLQAHIELKVGDKLTIAGYRVGKQFPQGFTTQCKPGHETVLMVTEWNNGGTLRPIAEPVADAERKAKRAQPQLAHGPVKRKRW